MNTKEKKEVASVLLKPIWVTPKNMAATVVKDGFVKASNSAPATWRKSARRTGFPDGVSP